MSEAYIRNNTLVLPGIILGNTFPISSDEVKVKLSPSEEDLFLQDEKEREHTRVIYNKKLVDDETYFQCEMCEKYYKSNYPNSTHPIIDGGCVMNLSTYSYGEFNDMGYGPGISILICHDCTLGIYRKTPKLKNIGFLHSIEGCAGEGYDSGKLFISREKERYTLVYQELFGEIISDSDEVDWPIFDEFHGENGPRPGGCEYSC